MTKAQRNPNLRQELLQAGVHLLSEQGYHGTGIKEILERVQVPKGSFYHYFSSKEGFTAEIIEDYTEDLLTLMDEHLRHPRESARETIRQMYGLMVTEFERRGCIRGCLLGNLAAEIGAASQQCQRALQKGYRDWRERFVPLIEQGQHNGEFRDDIPATALSDIFWNHWEGGILRMKLEGQAELLRADLDWLLDRLMAPATS
ncbi:TetR family transcriptional regulator C-terminal domain-containing protein [Salicola sp. Rm-C-2C1-2]|uniref:TetR/AcrR family transcriptional regulator n=1 Tax=Salicola sp. Rm-C-2C1-2 TaxID=3141321 RepID=UPI0032E43DD5